MRGHVFRSDDQGQNWLAISLGTKSAINGGTVAENGNVLLAGDNGFLAVSSDYGHSFDILPAPSSTPIGSALYADDGALVYVGYLAAGRLTATDENNLN